MGNKPSVLRSSSRAEEANATPRVAASGPSAALAEPPQQGEPSGSVAKLLTGNIASVRPVEQVPRGPTALDQKITSALRERWEARAQQDKDNQFTRILLKFPQAAEAFDSVRSTFRVYDRENKGYIEFADLSRVFEQLGANFSSEEISMVFQESDMMKDGKLNFKEFLVCLAIGFVLHKIPSLEGERLSIFYAPISRTGSNSTPASAPTQFILFGEGNKLRLAFQLAVDAFLWFDVDGDGVINRSEMSTKLQHSMALHSPTKKMTADDMNKDTSDDSSNQAIWEQRFMEMDWNGDGTIQFKEFLMAFESWVGLEDDDSMSTSSFRYAG